MCTNRDTADALTKLTGYSNTYKSEVSSKSDSLKDIPDQTLELCWEMIKKDVRQFEYAKCQTEDMCLYAVSKRGVLLKYAQFKTPEVCLAAITDDPYAIEYVDSPSEELQLFAIRRSPHTVEYIAKPTYKAIYNAVTLAPSLFSMFYEDADLDLWVAAITAPEITYPASFASFPVKLMTRIPKDIVKDVWDKLRQHAIADKDRTEAWKQAIKLEQVLTETDWRTNPALRSDGNIVRHFDYSKNQPVDASEAAIASDYKYFIYVDNQTPAMCLDVVKYYGELLCFVKDKTPEICKAAINSCPSAIRYIDNPSKELQLQAVEKQPSVVHLIDNLYPETIQLAISLNPGLKDKLSNPLAQDEDSIHTSLFGG